MPSRQVGHQIYMLGREMRPLVMPFLSSTVNFMVNYSEFLVNYSNIWFNMGPSACNWINGTQESHEKALSTVLGGVS